MTKNKYLPFNNSTPLHKNNLRAKMSVKKTKQSSTISFTINKADFERNFNNSGKMYQSWGVLIYDPLYFYWSTLWWSLIPRPLTKRSREVLNFYASPASLEIGSTHSFMQLKIFNPQYFFVFSLFVVFFKKNLFVKKNSVKEKYVMASFSNLIKINAIFR